MLISAFFESCVSQSIDERLAVSIDALTDKYVPIDK